MPEKITIKQYAEAVARFVELAKQETYEGRVAAQVLLSAYSGFEFQLDVSDLAGLDSEYYGDAITIIRGRCETGREPQTLLPFGSQAFHHLWKKWIHLHVTERGKQPCPDCDGRGVMFLNNEDEPSGRVSTCARCSGKGRVCGCSVRLGVRLGYRSLLTARRYHQAHHAHHATTTHGPAGDT